MNIKPSNVVTDKHRTYNLKEDNANLTNEIMTDLTTALTGNDINSTTKRLQGQPLHLDNRQHQNLNVNAVCEDCANERLCKFKDTALKNISKITQTVQEYETFEESDLIVVNYNCKYYKANVTYRK